MTKAEALLFIPLKKQDELEDLFANQFFLLKQRLLGVPLLPKLLNSKLDHLKNLELAYHTLGGKSLGIEGPLFLSELPLFSGTLLEQFDAFSNARNQLRLKLLQAGSHSELSLILKKLLELQLSYAETWNLGQDIPLDGILLSAEPDPMLLRREIAAFNLPSNLFSKSILNFPSDHLLLREAKRLTLYLIKASNE